MQSDPLGFAAGGTNLYAYTWNDPANWTDPSGLTGSGSYGRLTGGIVNLSRAATNRVGKSTLCLAKRFATLLAEAGSVLVDDHFGQTAMVISQLPGCRTKVRAPCGCGGRGGKGNLLIKALAFAASNFSFPEGTEVLTPDGPVAIETLREGDLVIARNEDTGVSGVFPVTAVMGRQASEVLWLTLENTEGEVTRMGVTPTHPLFIAGTGWGEAGELVAGDAIRDKDLQALTVLAIDVDTKPQMVHNLEIADAHTYFAGELEAWGHNGGPSKLPTIDSSLRDPKRCARGSLLSTVLSRDPECVYCGAPSEVVDHFWSHSHGGATDELNLRGCCRPCNQAKSNLTPLEWWKKFMGY